MMLRTLILILILNLSGFAVKAQSAGAFQKKFQEARNYMTDKDYGNAMTLFNELTYDHKKNEFVEMSHYYYSLCAFKNNEYEASKIMLSKLTSNYSSWKEIHEAYYLQGVISYAEGDFATGDAQLSNIHGHKLKDERESLKMYYLQKIQSIDSLLTLLDQDKHNKFLLDLTTSKVIAGSMTGKKRMILEYLIQDYGLKRADFESLLEKKTVFKDKYRVAVVLPFMLKNSKLEEGPTRRTRKYYELYAGIKLALDSLREGGTEFEIKAYDTRKDTAIVRSLLNKPEMKSYDLIIGPVWSKTTNMVSEFAEANQINFVNPISSRGNFITGTEHTFFYKPSGKTIANKCADYALAKFDTLKPKVLLFYGDNTKDSVMAATYKARMDSAGKEVIYYKITKENAGDFEGQILRLNPRQISHLMICTDDQFVGAHIMHPLEDQDIQVPTIVPDSWLGIHTITYSQMSRRNFHFVYSDYLADSIAAVSSVKRKFKEVLGMPILNDYGYVGYEVMYTFGSYLKKYGTLFNKNIRSDTRVKGSLSFGSQFCDEADNQVVPLLIFRDDYEFTWVNRPEASPDKKK